MSQRPTPRSRRSRQNTPPAWFMAAWTEYLADRDGVDHEPYLGDDTDYTDRCPIAALESLFGTQGGAA